MKYLHFFVCTLLILIVNNYAHAQDQITQSRFITGADPFSQTCSIGGGNNIGDCMPNVNGVVYMRFDTERLRINDNNLEFVVQVRKTGAALPYSVGGMAIDYNAEAFGENLNDPAFYDNDTDTRTNLGQCNYTEGGIFNNSTQNYVFTFRDTSSSLLSLFAEADDFTSSTATASSFATINNEWQDFIAFRCQIVYANEGNMNADAGLAFSSRLWAENQVWIADDGNASTANRIVFGIADNDLRGFRLDGKTWVEDYARHDDGKGVRLKFSKRVAAYNDGDTRPKPLTPANFIIDGAGEAMRIVTATHQVNEPYVNLRFESAVSNGILRLVSTNTRIVRDVDNVALADDNFVAALAYDTDAPYVTEVRRMVYTSEDGIGQSTWEIGFSKALNPDTVSKENLCLTDDSGICASADKPATTPTIVSVNLNDENSILTVVINEGRIGQALSPISLEFRRNAVLGEDFKIVEDYQTALRDRITLSDNEPLEITVRAIDMRVDINPDPNIETIYPFEAVPDIRMPNGNRYTMQFAVRANRPVSGISDESSYQLIAIPIDENKPVPSTSITSVVLQEAEPNHSGDATTLTYVVVLDSVAATKRIEGFTLARGTNSNFVDSFDIPPAVKVGTALDAAPAAIARRDTQRPNISVVQTSNSIDSNGYSLRFNITANEVLQPPLETDFTLLRELDGGSYAAVTSPVDFSVSNVDLFSYIVTAEEVRLSEAEARDTVGLTLGYGGDGLRDLANNDLITIGPERLFDDSDGAVAATHQTHPSINVVAQGAAIPDEDDLLVYRGAFEVSANTTLDTGISGANGIVGLDDGASYWLLYIPSDGSAPSTRTAQITAEVGTANTSATISFTVRFDSIDEVMQTMSFTLARRDNLQDFASNYPVDPVNTEDEIVRGDRLDSRDRAVAMRDSAPSYTVVAIKDSFTIAASGYTMAFRVSAPSDVSATQSSDLRQGGSYSLLRKLQGSDTYEVMSGRLVDEITVVTTGTVRVRYTNIPRLSIGDALNTEGFTLGRSTDDRLRDLASNDPVVSIGGATPTEVTTTPPLPLDASAQALFTIERDNPSLTVAPRGVIVKNGDMYRGSFDVSNTKESIDGIESSQSYVLLRVAPRMDDEMPSTPVVLRHTNISVGSVNFATLQSATVSFEVNDPDADANAYTLGRRDRLSDLVGNPLVDPMTNEEVTTNGRIDSRATAEAPIPTVNTVNPIISVVAENDGRATADTGNPLRYSGSFEVSVINEKNVSGISNADFYNLLRITRDDEHIITTGSTLLQVNDSINANILGQMATVTFSTTLTATSIGQTYGFTLGRRDNLIDDDNTLPLVDASRGNRLDASAAAVAVLDRSLQITAEAIVDTSEILTRLPPFNQPDGPKAYPEVDFDDNTVNGNRYSMIFEVRSLNGEAIPNIGSTSSYVLLHVPTTGTAIDLYRPTNYIVANAVEMVSFDQTQARVRYTVEFGATDDDDALAVTRRTAGFVLGRAIGGLQEDQEGDVQPLDSNGNPIADNARINPNDTAIAKRDTTSPAIAVTIVDSPIESDGIDIHFTLRTDSDESLQPQWNDGDDYVLLRRLSTSGWDIAIDDDYEQSITIRDDIGSARDFSISDYRLSQTDALNTEGFTLGYNRESPLRDLSNNDVIQGGTTQTALVMGQPFDISDAAFLPRDMNPPFIRVSASTPTVVDAQRDSTSYDIVFELASRELNDDEQEIDTLVIGLSSPESYQLLREIGEENYEVFSSDIYVARGERISEHRARIIYENVRLSIPQVQQTLSFTLSRAPNDPDDVDDCPLCDYWSNAPVVVGTTETATAGIPLDRSETARAGMVDQTGEMITVSAIGDAVPASRNANIYTGSFEVRSSDAVRGLNDARSYTLLRLPRVGADGFADGFGDAMETTATLMLSVDSSTTFARITFTTDLDDIAITQDTYGFTLGRAGPSIENDCVLCDSSGKLPVDRDGTIILTGSPLDTTTMAIVRRDIEAPRITVMANSLNKNGNNYTGSFDVSSTESIDGIASSTSYVLLRIRSGEQDVMLDDAAIGISIADLNSLRNAMIYFSVEDAVATDGDSFTLGRNARLADLSGNTPVDPADVNNPIEIGERIDSRGGAAIAIPANDTDNPIITVRANGNAIPTVNNRLVYQGSFDIASNKPVTELDDPSSYRLLHLTTDGATTEIAAEITVTPGLDLQVSVAFATTPTLLVNVSETIGFTLGRRANLIDESNNQPQVGEAGRLDANPDAIARLGRLILITSEAVVDTSHYLSNLIPFNQPNGPTAYPKVNDANDTDVNGNRYSMVFEVRSLNDEAVSDITSTGSYVLIHVPTTGTAIDLYRPNYIVADSVETITTDTHVRVRYTVSFGGADDDDALALTQRTAGFVLGRAIGALQDGNTQPLDSEGNAIDDNARIDPRTTAIAARDTQSPTVLVDDASISQDSNGFVLSFDLSTEFGEALNPQWQTQSSSGILRVNTGTANYSPVMRADTNVDIVTSISSSLRLRSDAFRISENEARETDGFTAGYIGTLGTSTLRDLSNNDAYQGGTTQAITPNQPFDIQDSALAVRDMIAPFIEVNASTATVASVRSDAVTYDMSFDVAAMQQNGEQKVAATDVRGLDSATSYQLLRVLTGGGLVAESAENIINSTATGVSENQARLLFSVRVPGNEIDNTVGFTLTRAPSDPNDPDGCPLCDHASNAPLVANTTETIAGTLTIPADGFKPLDRSDAAIANIEMPDAVSAPTLTVTASDARPNPDDGNEYTMDFVVQSTQPISGNLGLLEAYRLIHRPTTGTALTLSRENGLINDSSLTINDANNSVSISYTVRFSDTESQTQRTAGFALAANEVLKDMLANRVMNRAGEAIGIGAEIDTTPAAVARRDTVPPSYTVATEGDLSIAASGYTMAFRVSAPSDVPATQFSDLRQGGSYSLLRKLQGSDTYEVMPGRLVDEITIVTTGTVIVRYMNIPRLSIDDAFNTEGFTLGRSADDRLRDEANNDPVVSIGGTTQTVTTTPPLPLDASAQALFTVERDSPSLTVVPVPNLPVSKYDDTRYSGSFNVTTTEGIDGIESSQSYVLLRVAPRMDDEMPSTPVVLRHANISVGSVNFATLQSATVSFEVNDPDADTNAYTLGRRDRLSDLVGNPLVDPMTNEEVTTNGRIDSRLFAEAPIPTVNTVNPIISVVAANGRATADNGNPLRYSGSFEVSVINEKDVSGIRNAGSYNLLRIAKDGTHTITTAAAMIQVNDATTSDVLGQMATVVFSTTLTATSIGQTYGFTLGRRANLETGDDPPLVDVSRGNRLDASAAAVAVLDRSLQITAEAIVDTSEALTRLPPFNQPDGPKAYPEVDFDDNTVNGNRYSMIFEVRSLNGEAIPNIGSTSSYVLLHVPTTGIAIDLYHPTNYIIANTVEMISANQTQARVRYTVEFGATDDDDALAVTRRTAGFVLGRAIGGLQEDQEGDVQPLDSNGNPIADNARINPNDTAIAKRDTTSPAIAVTIVDSPIESDGIDIHFTLRTDSDESLQPQWNDGDDYVLLRRLSTSGWDIAIDDDYGQSITIRDDIGSARDFSIFGYRLSQTDALNTEGFTLGYNRESPLRDLSNNDVIQGGTTQTALVMGQPFDISDAAFLPRDMNPPFIRVSASTPTVVDAQRDSTSYDIVFELASRELNDDEQEIDTLVIGLSSPESYQLLREIGEENYEVFSSDIYVARGERISEHRARIIYENVRLSIPQVQQTLSFTLSRAPNDPDDVDDCPLCDYWSNAPVVVGTTETATAGIPLDRSETARAGMVDQTGEMITVSAIGDAVPASRNANIYTGSFEVRSSDAVRGLNDARSYTLLRLPRVGADGFADGFGDAMETTATLMLSVDSSTTFARITFTTDLDDIVITQDTYGFTLGRAGPSIENDCVLCDSSGKLPVNRDGTIILTGSPLDTTTTAIVRRDIVAPRITVMANSLNKNGNNYTGSFDVSSTESIDGIASSASYVLLRVRPGEQDEILDNAEIGISIADLNNLRSATIYFSVEDAVATDGDSFTLGRKARLADLSGNSPVDPADVNNPIGIGERIDSRGGAAIAIPANDTDNPIITVRANGNAIPTVNNRLVYQGSFDVASNKPVTELDDPSSYRLLHLTTDGATTEIAAKIDVSSAEGLQVSVAFATTPTLLVNVSETIGFTLGRRANLIDESNNQPQVGEAGRLDANPDAIARLGRLIQITSEAVVDTSHYLSNLIPFNQPNGPTAYPKVNDANDTDVNGNRYSMVFEVRSLNDEAVSDITSSSSYVLIHVPTTGTAIDLYRPNYIVENSVETITTDTHVRVRYTVSFGDADDDDALALTQRTAGFVLGRAMSALQDGNTQPLDSGGNAIGDNARIDPRTTAIAARDTQSPTVRVDDASISQDSNGFVLSFGLSTESGEALNPQWQTQSSSGILRVNTGTANYSPVMRADTNVDIVTSISSSLRLRSDAFRISENEARETDGFTAGYIGTLGTSTLRDLSNNDAYQGGTTQAITPNQPFDIQDSALAVRDMIAPFIEVNASTATVASVRSDAVTYDMSFDVAAMQQNGEQKVAATDVRGLDSATSYQLLRVLTGGGLVAESAENIINSTATGVSTNQARLLFSVRVPGNEIDNTVGFTLTRAPSDPNDSDGCPLCDHASNAPLVANTTETIAGTLTMPADGFKPLDRSDVAVANIDMPDAVSAPTLTVTASDARPNPDDGDEYTMDFVVQSTQPISGNLGLLDAYRLIHRPTTGTALTLSRENGLINDSSLTINDANNSVSISYTVRFSDTESQTQRTAGFALAANEVLRDMLANRAMNRAGEAIGIGAEIDTTPTAVARRDTVPPSYTLARESELSITASGYTMAFRVSAPMDVPATQSSGLRQDGSYSLLRKLQDSDTYEVMPGRLVDEITIVTTGTVIVRYMNIPRLSIDDALNTEGFTLGRSADDRLRDEANNDPVVSISGTTQTVTTTPPLPLDASAPALFTVERDSPSITVEPNLTVSKHGTRYSGSFNVTATEGIDGIESSQSYVLLRIEQRMDDMPSTPVVLPIANISVGSANFNDLRTVAIHFDVNDPIATSGHRFTLGRKDRLSDLVGNPLVDPETDEEVTTNGRIDSRLSAEAPIPTVNTVNPIISVVAANGRATADTGNPLRYSGSFEVSVINEKDVSGIRNAGSYNLLRIAKDGTHTITTAAAMIQVNDATTSDVLGQMATVVFSTTLTATSIGQTYGFTLGRRANLETGDDPPLVDVSRGDRLDASAAAVAILDRSLQITAEAIVDTSEILTRLPPFNQPDGPKAYPQVDFGDNTVNGNRYSMIFEMRSLNGEAITDIDNINSYVLLHVPTTGTAIDLSSYIIANTVEMVSYDRTQARVLYTVEFDSADDGDALALTQRTAGFVLGRAMGALQESDVQPLDSDGNFIADNARINPNDTAIAKRDTTSPAIAVTIVDSPIESDGIDIHFTLRTDESLQPQWNDGDDFVLLRRLSTSGWEIATGYGQSITIRSDIGSARDFSIFGYRLSQNDALNTEGFTLGYNGRSTLRDLSNNDVIQGGTTQTVLVMGQPFDIRDAAFLPRDMNPPFIEVTASAPTVASAQGDSTSYDIVFELASNEPVHGLNSPESYQLLREIGEENYEVVTPTYVARGERISDNRARIIYENVRLRVPDEVQQTLSFTLSRAPNNPDDVDDCPLCDYWSNAPVVANTTETAIAGIPLDRRDTAKARIVDKTGELITVSAIGDAVPDSRNPNIYTGSFEVSGNDSVRGLSDARSYTLLRLPRVGADGFADGFGAAMETAVTPMLSVDSSTTFSARINFTIDLDDIAITQRTYGFILGRASPSIGNDCVLCDPFGNSPVNRDGMIILAGSPLDTTTMAIVRRDIVPPRITVIPMDEFVDVQPNRYTMGFEVSASSDVADTLGSELRALSTYRLLRKLNTDNSYQMVSAVPSQTISRSGKIELIYNDVLPLTIEEISKTESFTLGLAIAGRLRDKSGNDPVVSAGGASITVDPPSPLDESTSAHLVVNRVGNPSISVTYDQDSNLLTKKGADYTGTFNLDGNRSIDGITSTESYVLLRVPQRTDVAMPSVPVVPLNDAHIGISRANFNNLQSATIYFAVSDPDATSKHSFALGRKTRLTDLVGNALIDPADDSRVEINERIDSRLNAEAQIPANDNENPIITVRAEGKAIPSSDNRLQYTGSFRVSSDESVTRLNDQASYRLLHLTTDGATTEIAAEITVSPGLEFQVSVAFATTLTSVNVSETIGFTLGRRANLIDESNNPPQVGVAGRLDASDDAIAKIDRPLRINAEAIVDTQNPLVRANLVLDNIRAYPDVDNGNRYSMVFRVRSETGDEIPDIGSTSSYVLLHIPITDADVVNDLSPYIESNTVEMISSNNTEAKVKYTVEFDEDDSTTAFKIIRDTAGFALGRAAGRLQIATTNPLNRLGNLIADGGRIDPSSAGIAMRDTTPPFVEVRAHEIVPVGSDLYRLAFDLDYRKMVNGQSIAVPLHNNRRSYQLLRETTADEFEVVSTGTLSYSSGTSNAMLSYNRVHLSPEEIAQTKSLTLGRAPNNLDVSAEYADRCRLCDYFSNAPVVAGTTRMVMIGEPLDANDRARIVIPQTAARLIVNAVGIAEPDSMDGDVYTMNFRVESDGAITGLRSLGSYRLIHKPTIGTALVLNTFIDNNNSSLTIDDANDAVNLSYTVRFNDTENQTQRTAGFTLARNAGLVDIFGRPATNRQGEPIAVGEEINTTSAAIAFRDTVPPSIAVNARGGKATETIKGSNIYDMQFVVTVSNGEQVRGFNDVNSYTLLQILKDGAVGVVMNSTATATTTDSGVVISHSRVRISRDESNPTVAFTLGREGTSLRDLANNDPVDANPENAMDKVDEAEEELDSRTSALARIIRAIFLRVRVFLEGPLQ